MRLAELEPKWLYEADGKTGGFRSRNDAPMTDAQGVRFRCPKCGGHSVLIWFEGRGVPEQLRPRPRWKATGTSVADLTLTPSILIRAPCGWHGFVTNGQIVGA